MRGRNVLNRTVSRFRATITNSFARSQRVDSAGTEWGPKRRTAFSLADGAGDRLISLPKPKRAEARTLGTPASGARPARNVARAATDLERRQSPGRLTMDGRKESK